MAESFTPHDRDEEEPDSELLPEAERPLTAFLDEIQDCDGLALQLLNEENPGIMAEVMETLTYEIISTEEQSDGSIVCEVEISSIDMETLLNSISDEADSKEAALEEMLDMAPDAERMLHTVSITLVPNKETGEYDLQYGNDVVNAVTGGMLSLMIEAYDMEVDE